MSLKCDFCPCVFCTSHDLELHVQKFGVNKEGHFNTWRKLHLRIECELDSGGGAKEVWRKSGYDEGEWCFVEDNPELASILRRNGATTMAGWDYSMNQKYIRKRLSKM